MGDAESAGERLSVRGAVEAIQRAQSYGEPLRRRAEGMTWMAWGLAAAGIFLTAAFLSYVVEVDWEQDAWVNFIWVPWVLVGIALTYAAWRMAGVTLAGPAVARAALAVAVAVAAALGTGFVASALAPAHEAAFPFLATGAGWTVLGATNLPRASAVGRRVMLAVGVALLVVGAVLAPFVPGLPLAGWALSLPLVIAVAGGLPFLAGLWQVVRG